MRRYRIVWHDWKRTVVEALEPDLTDIDPDLSEVFAHYAREAARYDFEDVVGDRETDFQRDLDTEPAP